MLAGVGHAAPLAEGLGQVEEDGQTQCRGQSFRQGRQFRRHGPALRRQSVRQRS